MKAILHQSRQSLLLLPLLVLLFWSPYVECYCWQSGWSPSFSSDPVISQKDMYTITVSWDGIVTKKECADNFLVKYWKTSEGMTNYEMIRGLSRNVDSVDIDVSKNIEYSFQVIATEDKGRILGVDWNKSPIVKFRTSNKDSDMNISDNTTGKNISKFIRHD